MKKARKKKGKRKRAAVRVRAKKQYLNVPQHIMEIRELGTAEKLLLAHIYSFGGKGCWQSSETLGRLFDVAPRTIKRRLARIRKFVYVRSPHSRLRTFLAKSHPDVREMAINDSPVRHVQQGQNCPPSTGPHLSGAGGESGPAGGSKPAPQQGQNCPSSRGPLLSDLRDKTGPTTGSEVAPPEGQICHHTITDTSTETNKGTPASTPPAPLQGAASAPGPSEEDRKRFQQIKARNEASRWKPLPQEEFERRRAKLKEQLRSAEKLERAFERPTSQEESVRQRAMPREQLADVLEPEGHVEQPEAPAAAQACEHGGPAATSGECAARTARAGPPTVPAPA